MLGFFTAKHVALIIFVLVASLLAYNSYGFGWKEREKTIINGTFWRITLYYKKHPAGGYEQYYRLYDMRDGANKLVKIGPPHLDKETTEFGAVQHPQTGDSFSPDAIVYINERFANERGFTEERMRAFLVKNANDIRLF